MVGSNFELFILLIKVLSPLNGSCLRSAREDSTPIPYQRPYFLILILANYMRIDSL